MSFGRGLVGEKKTGSEFAAVAVVVAAVEARSGWFLSCHQHYLLSTLERQKGCCLVSPEKESGGVVQTPGQAAGGSVALVR